MTELRDGFFYHPDGDGPTSHLKRLIAGEHNHALDDPHCVVLNDTDNAIAQAKSEYDKAQIRLVHLKTQIAVLEDGIRGLKDHIDDLEDNRVEVVDAIRHFEETGELDDILIPEPDRLLGGFDKNDEARKATEIADAWKALDDALTDEWDVANTRADDEFVYVTVKRRRESPPTPTTERPTRDVVAATIWQAFETFAREFKDVVRPPRLASVTVGPRSPP